jgi:hypothetical protein
MNTFPLAPAPAVADAFPVPMLADALPLVSVVPVLVVALVSVVAFVPVVVAVWDPAWSLGFAPPAADAPAFPGCPATWIVSPT